MATDDPEDFDALFDRAFTPAGVPGAVAPRAAPFVPPAAPSPPPPPAPAPPAPAPAAPSVDATQPLNRFIAAPAPRERRAADVTGPISKVETITVGILLTDQEGIVKSANAVARRIFGGPEGSLEGRPVAEVFPDGDALVVAEQLEAVRAGRAPAEVDLAIPTPRGPLSVRLSVKGRFDEEKHLREVLFTLREVAGDPGLDVRIRAAKVDALAELGVELGREVGPILSRVGDALRTAQRMLEPAAAGVSEQEREALRATIADATAGLLRLQEAFAELDRFAFDLPMKIEPVDPSAVFARAEALLARSLRARRVKVRNEMDEPAPRVMADTSRLTEIFVNLLRNARNAILKRFESADETSPGTVRRLVVVESFVKGSYVCITLTNNGVPIPAAEVERIFVPSMAAKDRRGGVGLPETAALMKEMGGAIQCQAVEDQGTRFLLTFRKAD